MGLIEIKKATIGYRRKAIVHDINLSVEKGDFIFFLGDNGSGKTTLVKTILGLLPPLKGEVHVSVFRHEMGYIPQRSQMDIHLPMTLEEFVSLGSVGDIFPQSKSEIEERIANALNEADLSDLKNKQLMQLSGGQRQRACVARALVRQPRLLLADEPTNGLDRNSLQSFVTMLEKLNSTGTTVIVVTHDHLLVEKMNKKVVTFNKSTVMV